MQASDFRLGNFIQNKGLGLCRITTISEDLIETKGVYSSDYDRMRKLEDIVPVKLTKEWLPKLNFDYQEILGGYADDLHIIFEDLDSSFIFMPYCTNDIDCHIKIEFVHELQNVYYTNSKKQELKLK